MTTDKPDSECFNVETLREIVSTNSTTDRHYDCATTEIVPRGGGGAGDGLRDDGHGSGGGKRAQQPVDAQNGALDERYHPAHVADDFNSADDEQIAADIDAVLAAPDLALRLEEGERLRQVGRLAGAIYRTHAKVPVCCPCESGCYCKTHTCKPKDTVAHPCDCWQWGNDNKHSPECVMKQLIERKERAAHHDAYPEARGGAGDAGRGDANATLNLLRDLEQRVQAVHRCGDAEQARLLLVAIKGILNGAIAEREQR